MYNPNNVFGVNNVDTTNNSSGDISSNLLFYNKNNTNSTNPNTLGLGHKEVQMNYGNNSMMTNDMGMYRGANPNNYIYSSSQMSPNVTNDNSYAGTSSNHGNFANPILSPSQLYSDPNQNGGGGGGGGGGGRGGYHNNNNNNHNNHNSQGQGMGLGLGSGYGAQPNGFASIPFMNAPMVLSQMNGGGPAYVGNNSNFSPMPSGVPNALFTGGAEEFEVNDYQLKAPIPVRPYNVIPTIGSERLFSSTQKPSGQGARNVFRICDGFQKGSCCSNFCADIHVQPDYLHAMREQMNNWLSAREAEFNNDFAHHPDKIFRVFVAEVKEVVDVPIRSMVFTRGLYVDPTTRVRRTRGATTSHSATVAAQVPTGCGLYAADPAQCRWGRWCNQVHIDPAWMKQRKVGFDRWFSEIEQQYVDLPLEYIFTVHDPQLKTSLKLPKWSIVDFSRGLFQGSDRKAPSVCLLFQRGRCTAGSCCNQIHVSPVYLDIIRRNASALVQGELDPTSVSPALAHEIATLRASRVEEEKKEAAQLLAQSEARLKDLEDNKDVSADAGEALFEHITVDDDLGEIDAEPTTGGFPAEVSTNSDVAAYLPGQKFNNGIAIGGVGGERNQNNSSTSFKRTPMASMTGYQSQPFKKSVCVTAHLPELHSGGSGQSPGNPPRSTFRVREADASAADLVSPRLDVNLEFSPMPSGNNSTISYGRGNHMPGHSIFAPSQSSTTNMHMLPSTGANNSTLSFPSAAQSYAGRSTTNTAAPNAGNDGSSTTTNARREEGEEKTTTAGSAMRLGGSSTTNSGNLTASCDSSGTPHHSVAFPS